MRVQKSTLVHATKIKSKTSYSPPLPPHPNTAENFVRKFDFWWFVAGVGGGGGLSPQQREQQRAGIDPEGRPRVLHLDYIMLITQKYRAII